MEDLYIKATNDSPEVDFKYTLNQLTISGEAYPEDASRFFYPVIMGLVDFLKINNKPIQFNFKLTYFNSASTKMLFNIFKLLNEHSANHQQVTLNWIYDEEDDTIKEFGDEIAEEFPKIEFNAVTIGLV